MPSPSTDILLQKAHTGLDAYLREAVAGGTLTPALAADARARALPALRLWLEADVLDTLSPNARAGIAAAIEAGRWPDLLNTFQRAVRFGTAGIRALMAFDKASILRLRDEGPHAAILKGPNTFNDVVLLLTASGAAAYGLSRPTPFSRVVIGHDTRVCSPAFARLTAELFLAHGYTVFLFDGPCPYPETGFALTRPAITADLGLYISSSHNDYRYNGFKIIARGGAQLDTDTRNAMFDGFIAKTRFSDIRRLPLDQAPPGRLIRLGESPHAPDTPPLHAQYRHHLLGFLSPSAKPPQQDLSVATCAYHGSGRILLPRLLEQAGFPNVRVVRHNRLDEPDGLFPAFHSEAGQEQQPDPGDERAAAAVLAACRADYPELRDTLDLLIGTDPDADRCAVSVRVPPDQQALYGGDFTLLPANELWTLLLWFRLSQQAGAGGLLPGADRQFLTLSHVTQDSLTRVALKFGLGVVKTWVGFPALAAGNRAVWEMNHAAAPAQAERLRELTSLQSGNNDRWRDRAHPVLCECLGMSAERAFNAVTCEQSNGFTVSGERPEGPGLGRGGHVPDKDGLLAGLLAAEAAAWGKARGMTLIDMLDRCVYLDPAIGLFVGGYEPDPLEGEYPGLEGDRIKLAILARALDATKPARAGTLVLGGRRVTGATLYRTGRYDAVYPPSAGFVFPDEGIRFHFGGMNHITVRPSGTGNSLRFYQQLHEPVTGATLPETKARLMRDNAAILNDLRALLQAPRKPLHPP
ncbi:MAG: hypothetical protein R6X19_10440 [Kiritimatiellia bacterium]